VSRAPLVLDGGRPTSSEELWSARELIRRSGVIDVLSPHIDNEWGRPRRLTLEGLFVGLQLNALQPRHQAHLVQVARVLNALNDDQRGSVGIARWIPAESYDRVTWLFARVTDVLESGKAGVDAEWFANALARAAIPAELLTSQSVAVDGTDVETWGVLHGASRTVVVDGEAAETQLIDGRPAMQATRKVRTAKSFGIGPDGRKRYTKDPDARAGHRSATNQRLAGPYVGYELHLAVQTRDVRWTNYIDKVTLSPEVPGVITSCVLVAAGSHRAKSVVDRLIEAAETVQPLSDVVWDPGYSLCAPETAGDVLGRHGIEQTLQPVTHQRGIRPFAGEALLLDGQLYSRFLPADLRDLAMPPRYAPGPYRAVFEEKFNSRARWRYVRHSRPDEDGVTRWKCPFCAGLLRSRQLPTTMRRSRNAPLALIPEAATRCCGGTLSEPPSELPIAQRIPFGTTAWRRSMDRRQVVESANAALKGGFADLSRGFFRVFGRTKITVLIGFTAAAYNLDRVRSFLAKKGQEVAETRRSKRRKGIWSRSTPRAADPVPTDSTGPPGVTPTS
jgi:hypothetical protein